MTIDNELIDNLLEDATEAEAEQRLAEFSLKWDVKFPTIAKSWRGNWARVIPFFAHPPEIRKVIYTTNAIESLNMSLRKVTKARGSFPNDEAVFKLLYLRLLFLDTILRYQAARQKFPKGPHDLTRPVVLASVFQFECCLASEPCAFIERKTRGIQLRQSRRHGHKTFRVDGRK